MKHFGFYSGIYYNALGKSGNASLRRYVNRIARAFQRAVTIEQLVCEGRVNCEKLINSVKSDLNMLPNFEFLRTNEEAKRGIYYFLDGVSLNAAGWNGKGKVEQFIARNFFKKESKPKGMGKYGVQLASHYTDNGEPVFYSYVVKRTPRSIVMSHNPTFPYHTLEAANKVIEDVNRGRYAYPVAARLVTRE